MTILGLFTAGMAWTSYLDQTERINAFALVEEVETEPELGFDLPPLLVGVVVDSNTVTYEVFLVRGYRQIRLPGKSD
jgi:hypothetical protein